MRGRSWPKAPGLLALLALWVLGGCLKKNPDNDKTTCRAAGGLVVHDGHPVCSRVTRCQSDDLLGVFGTVCKESTECEPAPWHCEFPAEAKR